MGRVTLEHIEQGNLRYADVVNANFDAIEAQTAALDDGNYRPEGFDLHAVDMNAIVRPWFVPVAYSALAVIAPGAAFGNLVLGATTFNVPVPTNLQANELGVIMFRCQVATDAANVGIPINSILEFRLSMDIAAAPTLLTMDHRWESGTVVGRGDNDFCVAIKALYLGAGSALTNLKVQVRGTAATNYQVGYARLYGFVYSI